MLTPFDKMGSKGCVFIFKEHTPKNEEKRQQITFSIVAGDGLEPSTFGL